MAQIFDVPVRDRVPKDVLPFLLPTDWQVLTVRRHPIVLAPLVILLFCDVAAFALGVASVFPGSAVTLTVPGILVVPLCYLLYRSILAWLRVYFVVTESRLLLIGWPRAGQLETISIAEADDMSFARTLPGRLVGYGTFTLRRSGFNGRVHNLRYLPYPEQLYLEVVGLIFRDS